MGQRLHDLEGSQGRLNWSYHSLRPNLSTVSAGFEVPVATAHDESGQVSDLCSSGAHIGTHTKSLPRFAMRHGYLLAGLKRTLRNPLPTMDLNDSSPRRFRFSAKAF